MAERPGGVAPPTPARSVPTALTRLLVCVACRFAPDGPSGLRRQGHSLTCRRCGARYPVDHEGTPDLRPPTAHAVFGDDTTEQRLFAQFLLAQDPAQAPSRWLAARLRGNARLPAWIDRTLRRLGPIDGPALELGCGPVGAGAVWARHAGWTVLADVRPRSVAHAARVHRAEPRLATLVCDAHDPPFEAGSLALVAALNLLDVSPQPWLLLGQIDALLRPGGRLVLALPYADHLDGPAQLRAVLSGRHPGLPQLDYLLRASRDGFTWGVPVHDRLVMVHRVHALIADKRGGRR